jgi:hypothetical protein
MSSSATSDAYLAATTTFCASAAVLSSATLPFRGHYILCLHFYFLFACSVRFHFLYFCILQKYMNLFGTIWEYVLYFHELFFDFLEFSLRYLDNLNKQNAISNHDSKGEKDD